MHPFTYTRASDIPEVLDAGRSGGRYLAGGTTLVELMCETVERPAALVDISGLPLDASVHPLGPDSEHTVPLADFHLRPGSTPDREQAIGQGELITAVEIPAHPRPRRSGYLKVRDRQSCEFALTSVAVALHIRGGVIREAKAAAGGVGTVPWKLPAVEHRVIGERPSDRLWAEAAAHAADGARTLSHNRFKVQLLKRTVERQLRVVGGGT